MGAHTQNAYHATHVTHKRLWDVRALVRISSGSVRRRVTTVGLHIILRPPKLHVQAQVHDHVIAVISLSVRHV